MRDFTYRKVSPEEAARIIDWAEANEHDFDVWNMQATLLDASVDWEIGLSPRIWQIYFHTRED
jgi:hypothetical protein